MKIIVLDSAHPLGKKNQCFESFNEKNGCGFAFPVRLAQEVKRRGWKIMTGDVYLSMHEHSENAVLITEMVSPNTELLLATNIKPIICFSLESPLMAQKFYYNLKHYAGRYHYNYQFLGAQNRLKTSNTVFKSFVFPVETRKPILLIPWTEREFMVMVNSNKRAINHNFKNIWEAFRTLATEARSKFWKYSDQLLRLKELYVERVEAIRYFSNIRGFHLYGFGWDGRIQGFSETYNVAVRKCYIGTIDDDKKRQVIGSYKYCLCFENTIFPGYITEKITDCFLAGCIPVYWGAPDITDFVPANTFIDFRNFDSFDELNTYLCNLTEFEAINYIDAANDFLSSKAFDKFDMDILVGNWCDLISSI